MASEGRQARLRAAIAASMAATPAGDPQGPHSVRTLPRGLWFACTPRNTPYCWCAVFDGVARLSQDVRSLSARIAAVRCAARACVQCCRRQHAGSMHACVGTVPTACG
jgi:hypothetical protein